MHSSGRNKIAVYVACSLPAGAAGVIHTLQLYPAETGSGEGFPTQQGTCYPQHGRPRLSAQRSPALIELYLRDGASD
jgi:hypothetical protein